MGCFLFWKEMPLCVLHFPGHWKMQLCKCNSTRYVPKASSYTTKWMSAWRLDSFYSKTCISWFQSASGHSHLFWENLDWASGRQGNKAAGSTYSCTVCNKNNMQVWCCGTTLQTFHNRGNEFLPGSTRSDVSLSMCIIEWVNVQRLIFIMKARSTLRDSSWEKTGQSLL